MSASARRIGLAMVVFITGSSSAAQPACDTRGYPPSSPTSRFDDHADGTVTDRQTRLMWMRCSIGQRWLRGACVGSAGRHTWASANASADEVNRSGSQFFSDWRVPLLRELSTIAERQCEHPRVNLAVFPDTPAATYWSASSRASGSAESFAFALSFAAEGVAYRDKQEAHHLRLVRSVQ